MRRRHPGVVGPPRGAAAPGPGKCSRDSKRLRILCAWERCTNPPGRKGAIAVSRQSRSTGRGLRFKGQWRSCAHGTHRDHVVHSAHISPAGRMRDARRGRHRNGHHRESLDAGEVIRVAREQRQAIGEADRRDHRVEGARFRLPTGLSQASGHTAERTCAARSSAVAATSGPTESSAGATAARYPRRAAQQRAGDGAPFEPKPVRHSGQRRELPHPSRTAGHREAVQHGRAELRHAASPDPSPPE